MDPNAFVPLRSKCCVTFIQIASQGSPKDKERTHRKTRSTSHKVEKLRSITGCCMTRSRVTKLMPKYHGLSLFHILRKLSKKAMLNLRINRGGECVLSNKYAAERQESICELQYILNCVALLCTPITAKTKGAPLLPPIHSSLYAATLNPPELRWVFFVAMKIFSPQDAGILN